MNIHEIIKNYLSGKLNEHEVQYLENWLSESEENRSYFLRIKEIRNLCSITDPAITDQEKELLSSARNEIIRSITTRKRRTLLRADRMIKYVAAFIGFMVIGVGGFYLTREQQQIEITQKPRSQSSEFKALLYKGDEIIPLDSSTTSIREIVAESRTSSEESRKNNRIVVPKGCRYTIILPDSSTVHLNSDTELRFPDKFSDTLRQVELKGEGFFNVTPSKRAPFIVKFNENNVRVLGTQFNIKSYADISNPRVTLVEGSVKVNNKEKNVILKPREQAIINNKENTIEQIEINPKDYLGWIDGGYYYYNQPFEEIAEDLSRRYNWNFKIDNESLKTERLTIRLSKETSLSDMIKTLNRAGESLFCVKLNKKEASVTISLINEFRKTQ